MTEQYIKYWELFIKKQSGSISTSESQELDTWIAKNSENASKIHEFEQILNLSAVNDKIPSFDPHEDWQDLQTMIKVETESHGVRQIRMFPWIARIAAAVILIIGFTFIFYQYQNLSSDELNLQTMVQTDDSGQRIIELPDGSTVWLNRKSELLYPESFDGETRTLYLKGEAFFEVTPDKNKPFIVHSGSSKTTVLGTSFNLRAYGKEDEVKLTVVTGKVAFTLADDKEGVIVTPGDAAVFNNHTKSISQLINEDVNFLSWKTGQLLFDDSPLDQLIFTLERHYNVDISVENEETLSCRFTGDFQETDIENTMKIITRATGTSFIFKEGHYTIEGSGCN